MLCAYSYWKKKFKTSLLFTWFTYETMYSKLHILHTLINSNFEHIIFGEKIHLVLFVWNKQISNINHLILLMVNYDWHKLNSSLPSP